MYVQESIAVFTVPERIDVFRSVIGERADYRTDPFRSVPLDIVLENLRVGGCSVAIFDESHFFSIELLAEGLCAYLNKHSNKGKFLRVIVVCQNRNAGDEWLSFFAGYLGIYDIVYGKSGVDAAMQLARLLERGNERVDVVHLLHDPRERQDEQQPDERDESHEVVVSGQDADIQAGQFDIRISVCVEPK